jgi:hypothetical protein
MRCWQDNVALIVVLDSLEAPDLDQPGKRQLVCVANTHIHANPELKDVKLWQVLAHPAAGTDTVSVGVWALAVAGVGGNWDGLVLAARLRAIRVTWLLGSSYPALSHSGRENTPRCPIPPPSGGAWKRIARCSRHRRPH